MVNPRRGRVAFVGPGFPPTSGGVEFVMENLARIAATSGYEVDVLVQVVGADRSLEPVERLSSGVVVRRFASPLESRRFPIAPGLAHYLRKHKADYQLIHGHSFHAAPSALAALVTDLPLIFTPHYHGSGHTPLARAVHHLYSPFARYTFRRAAQVVAVSEQEAALLTARYPSIAKKLSTIYNGVDVDPITAAPPYVESEDVVLIAGRLEDYKRVDLLLRSLPLLKGAAHLVVTGDGPASKHLGQLIRLLRLDSRVSLVGHLSRESLRRWQRTASVYVTLSLHEAFNLGMLEAIAARCKVLASDIPAHRELVKFAPAGTAILLPVDSGPQEVAIALDRLLSSPTPVSDGLTTLPTWDDAGSLYLRHYDRLATLIPNSGLAG